MTRGPRTASMRSTVPRSGQQTPSGSHAVVAKETVAGQPEYHDVRNARIGSVQPNQGVGPGSGALLQRSATVPPPGSTGSGVLNAFSATDSSLRGFANQFASG
jgi:hypothetical protein